MATRPGARVDPAGLRRLAELLQQAVARMEGIEAHLAEGGDRFRPRQANDPAVRWLEDDELAGRLQRILRRQARDHGIDVS